MSTGLESFSNPQDIGPMYPFAGLEVVLVIVAVVLWIAWHVVQTREENREYAKAIEVYEQIGLDRAMLHGGGGHIAGDVHDEPAAQPRGAGEP